LVGLNWSDKPLTCDEYNGGASGYQAVEIQIPPNSQSVGKHAIGAEIKVTAIDDQGAATSLDAGEVEILIIDDNCVALTISGTTSVNGSAFGQITCG
jgi:hypothetical protein